MNTFFLIPSLDRQIFTSDVIVLAEFVSATAAVKTIPGKPNQQPTYRPAMTLTFTATEYLKGSGPNTFSVELWDKTGWNEEYLENGQRYAGYLTEAKALAKAQALVAARKTTYDDRPGVMFLNGPVAAASGSGARSGGNFDLALFNTPAQGSFKVDVDSMSRAWLPTASGVRSGDAAAEKDPTIVTNRPPPDSALEPSTDPNTMQLSALKTRITEIAAMITAGDGTKAYSDCLHNKLTRHEWYRGKTFPGRTGEWEIASGAAAGTELLKSAKISGSAYNVYSTSGADAAHFSETIVDDDAIASNSYYTITAPTRPLPAGAYTANFHLQHHRNLICGFNPTHSNYTTYNVTVTAPYGTLHEAFFDPVSVGTSVKADGSNGVLKPTSFTVGSTSTEITSLEWSSNQVVLTLDPHVSLSGNVLDFIALDGSVALSLFTDSATVDSTAGTYSWTMTSQPWADGDKLMLRIRPVGTEIFLTNLPSSMVQGVTHWFMVNLTNLNRSRSYSYRLSADNADVAFHNSACHSAPVNVTVSAGETSYARQHALLGCGTPGSTVTATLLEGTTEVDTTTYSVTVTPPPPSVEIQALASIMEVGGSDSFVISASYLDTANSHTIRLTTDNANMGFDTACTDQQEDIPVGQGRATYVNSRILYGCTAPGGTLTVTLLQGETVVDTTTYDVEVTPPPSPSVEFLNSPYTLESGGSVVVRMRVSNLDADSSYTIRVAPDNANLGYNQDCTSREFSDGTSGRNSFSTFFTLYGCASPGGTLTVTLLEGTTEVNTATQDVTVTP